MFALEVDFHDGVSPPETILVRRSNAIIGSGEMAHVVIEGGASSELRLVRGLGRQFSCVPVRRSGQESAPQSFLEGDYLAEASLQLGEISLHVTSLDTDLLVAPNEFPDRAALRIFRAALAKESPEFPAVAVIGSRSTFVSFQEEDTLLIGRTRDCGLRLDSSDVSAEHARVGIEEGRPWVEDLASTNGTYVGEERISGRRYLKDGETFRIGSEFSLAVVLAADGVSRLATMAGEEVETVLAKSFPCIVSQSDSVRPKRYPLRAGVRASVGRDPANDIWISAAHISRRHLEFLWDGQSSIKVIDFSSNGTFLDNQRLERGVPLEIDSGLSIFDFSSGVNLALCFSEEEENNYLALSEGDLATDSPYESLAEEGFGGVTGINEFIDPETQKEEYYSQKSAPRANVFEQMAAQNANQAQDSHASASEYFDSEQLFGSGASPGGYETGKFAVPSQAQNPGGEPELSAFEQYQRSQQLEPEELFEAGPDYNLLSHGQFDEDFLEEHQESGVRSALLMVGVVGLVILILVVCITIFTSNYFY